jgi:arsenite-transporting ATPase
VTHAPEAAAQVARALAERRLLFVGGKGGVGKTTIAAALGVTAAANGRRCLVVSTDPAHSLGDVFGVSIGGAETPLAERLHGLEIDPDEEAERHIAAVKQHMLRLVHPRMYDAVNRQLDLARLAPGTIEAALVERMARLMDEAGRRFDLVIFDTAPTGQTLRLLALPEIMAAWTDGLLRHRDRASRLAGVLERLGGSPTRADDLSLIDGPAGEATDARTEAITETLRSRRRTLGRARELLLDADATAFVLVLNPDKLSLLESQKALASLGKARVPVAAVVVNRVLCEEGGGAFFEARRRQEAGYREAIDQAFSHLPRATLPLLAEDVHGVDALGALGRTLTTGQGTSRRR